MVLFCLLEGQGHSYNNNSKGKEEVVNLEGTDSDGSILSFYSYRWTSNYLLYFLYCCKLTMFYQIDEIDG